MRTISIVALVWAMVFAGAVSGWANPKHLQAYKKAFPDAKAKCNVCHVKDKVTKTDNELNAYGAKAKEMGEPSKEGYEAIGAAPAVEDASSEAK